MAGRQEAKIAIVTGASRGLGLRITEKLVEEGARVVMLARSQGPLEEAAKRFGDAVMPIASDVTDPAKVKDVFARIAREWGGVDILINNAAVGYPMKIDTADDDLIMAEVTTNYLATIYCIREAVPLMRARGGGDIMNISSESVGRPVPFLATYGAVKAAVEALSRNLRSELKPDGIRVMVLRSGRMNESGFSTGWDKDVRAQYVKEAIAQGSYYYAGEAISPASTAQAIVDVLSLPKEAHVDFIELRSNIPFTPK